MLAFDGYPDFISDLIQLLTQIRKRLGGMICIHDHHHVEIFLHDRLRNILYINIVICQVCTYLADHKINILDISQTIVQEYFNMMMIVDGSGASVSFDEMASGLDEIGAGIGVNIKCQREEIFTKMHRI